MQRSSKMYLFAVALVVALTACGTTAVNSGGTTTTGPSAQAQIDVYKLQRDYNAGLIIAVAYKNLPDCAVAGHPILCSQDSVIKQLQDADDIAAPSLLAAQNTVRAKGATNAQTALIAAQEAVNALTTITSKLTVK
jgi:hypothetical protein